jgi:hypothetical protein
MLNLKKRKKIWIYYGAAGILIIGGSCYTLSRTSFLPTSWKIFSQCRFDPTISEKNKALIDETITTVAHKGLFSLLGEKSHLEDMGTILSKEVPDLTYWAYILSHPKLKKDMLLIQDSSPKYNGFIEGTRNRIMREYKENPCLLKQAEGFADYLDLPEDKTVAILKECIENDSKDDEAFKKFLDFIIGEGKKEGSNRK